MPEVAKIRAECRLSIALQTGARSSLCLWVLFAVCLLRTTPLLHASPIACSLVQYIEVAQQTSQFSMLMVRYDALPNCDGTWRRE